MKPLAISVGRVPVSAWPRLEGWLAADQQGRALRRHLAPAATDWDAGGREPAELYRGVRLNAVLEWVRDRPPGFHAPTRRAAGKSGPRRGRRA